MQINHDWLSNLDNHCLNEAVFREMVAQCAYFKSEQRGFVWGFALQDWLEAEVEISKRCSYWFQE
ncbi:MAG: DUF2934 domain-containing protein [Methylococcaceae bacterium]|nr:DUF2934 domain-containing protein [Methylococcaceae bacterium]